MENKPRLYGIGRGGKRAFGDSLLAGYLTSILLDNGLNAFCDSRVAPLLDLPVRGDYNENEYNIYWHKVMYGNNPKGKSIIDQIIWNFRMATKEKALLPLRKNYIPVKFKENPETSQYDVVIGEDSGPYSIYRKWPYFNELKSLLSKDGISYLSLSGKWNDEVLQLVNKAKLYLGLDTGTSHYVSQVANGKTLIIQSGFSRPSHWCNYDYEFIQNIVPCSPCALATAVPNSIPCMFNHMCMRDITPDYVLHRIKKKLKLIKSTSLPVLK